MPKSLNFDINPKKCIGYWLCIVTCPNDAIKMKRVEREEIPGLKAYES